MLWPADGLRRASVNSFGYGGSNTHVVLDDAYNYLKSRQIVGKHCKVESPPRLVNPSPVQNHIPAVPSTSQSYVDLQSGSPQKFQPRLLVWSVCEKACMKRLATDYQEHLLKVHDCGNTYLNSFSYTLSNRRSNLPWKSFLIADSVDDIQKGLSSRLSRPIRSSSENKSIGFVFTGHGAQWHAMGPELFVYPIFRNSFRSAENYLRTLGCEWSLISKAIYSLSECYMF